MIRGPGIDQICLEIASRGPTTAVARQGTGTAARRRTPTSATFRAEAAEGEIPCQLLSRSRVRAAVGPEQTRAPRGRGGVRRRMHWTRSDTMEPRPSASKLQLAWFEFQRVCRARLR